MAQGKAKGSPKTGGRKKGTPNKTTSELKTAIMQAFDKAGGSRYLENIAQVNPAVFCQLLGKVLPKEIEADINNHNTGEITVKFIKANGSG